MQHARTFWPKKKAFTKARDDLTRERQNLPWVRVEKDYVFEGPDGKAGLGDLFGRHSQLIVSHFMFGPDWQEGCPSCSFWADGYDPMIVHLAARDVAFAAVSRTSIENIEAYRKRMGWSFNWVSSLANDFNQDFHVSFSKEELDSGQVNYNFERRAFPAEEAPGLSVFQRDDAGAIFSHVLVLCARSRYVQRCLPSARHHAKGTRRRHASIHHVLVTPA